MYLFLIDRNWMLDKDGSDEFVEDIGWIQTHNFSGDRH
jgi:hypothetical protein